MYVKWEYKVWSESERATDASFFEKQLNELASEGWELITLKVSLGIDTCLIFKRPDPTWLKAEQTRMKKAAGRLRELEQPRSEIFTTADACCREDPERRKLEVES